MRSKRTMIIVEVPVMAKTVHIRTISPYQAVVHLGGISFGPIKRWKTPEKPETFSAPGLISWVIFSLEGCFGVEVRSRLPTHLLSNIECAGDFRPRVWGPTGSLWKAPDASRDDLYSKEVICTQWVSTRRRKARLLCWWPWANTHLKLNPRQFLSKGRI